MANVIEIIIKQTGQGSAISSTVKDLGGIKGVGDTAISTLLGVGKALTGVGAIAATALVGFAASGVKAAMDVDHQLAQIAATLGTTKDAAMPLKDLMTQLALDPKLTVNVTQAGEAIEVLAANGLEMSEILAGGAKGAVQLANATGSDFATAATIATDAMQQFGFEANQLETVADGIAGVLIKSKFSADDYALALSNAGGIAGSLGVEMSDFNTVLAATSSQFASGSDAGTSFKTLLTRLAKPTDEVSAAMVEYGISIFDADGKMRPFAEIAGQLNKVFNESITTTTQVGGATKEQAKAAELASSKIGDLTRDIGLQEQKMKTLSDEYALQLTYYDAESPKMQKKKQQLEGLSNTITDQKEKLAEYQSAINLVSGAQSKSVTSTKKLTEEQKAALATTLGGTDAMRTILSLSEMTEEQFSALSGEVNKSGLASQAAATRVDSLTGTWEIFKGIIEAVQLQVGDKFLPIIRQVTEAVSVWASENSGGIVAFFGGIATGIDSLIAKGMELAGAFQSGGTGGLLSALGIGPEGIELFDKVAVSITSISDTIANVFTPALESITGSGVMDAINTGLAFLNEHFAEIQGAILGIGAVLATGVFVALAAGIMSLVTPLTLLVAGAALLGAAWMGNWGGIQEIVGAAVTYISERIAQLSGVLAPAIASFQESFARLSETFGGSSVMIDTFMAALSGLGSLIVGTLIPAWVEWIGFLAGLGASAFSAWVTYAETAYSAFQSLSGFIQSDVVPVFVSMGDALSVVGDLFESSLSVQIAIVNKASEALGGLWQNVLLPAITKVGNFLKSTMVPVFASLGQSIKEDVSPGLRDLSDVIMPMLTKGIEFVNEAIQRTISYFNSLASTVNNMSLPDWLQMHSPPPLAQALTMSADAASKATAGLANMQKQMITSTSASHDFIDSLDMGQFKGIGGGIGGGAWRDLRSILKQNISGSMGALADGLAPGDIMGQVTSTAQQWRIPPEYAASIAEANGLVEHLTSNFAAFQKQMNIENLGNMMQMAGSLSSLDDGFASALQEQMGSAETAKKVADAYKKLTGEIRTQETQLSTLQQELVTLNSANELDTVAIDAKTKAIEKLTEGMRKNVEAAAKATTEYDALAFGSLNERIAFFKAFIESGEATVTATKMLDEALTGATSSSFTWDTVRAQEELNTLLAEQTRQEALITAQKESQQKLDFLKSQLDLIKLGQGLGGDIFKGIKFGLDANTEDLLAATNAIVDAMVGQINTDLQMASPSKLLFKMFKDNVGGAMVGGLMAVKPLMQGAISPILDPIVAGAQAAGKVVNNYFNQTVNTQADQSSVIGDFRTMQLMAMA